MSSIKEIEAVEQSIKRAKTDIDSASAMERLRSNRDFIKVLTQGYFEQEAIRLVHLKADPSMQNTASQASIVLQMDAIGALVQYFNIIVYKGGLAIRVLESDQETLTELMQEGAE